MNKYLILILCFSLSAMAQTPDVEMSSETVAVPDILDPTADHLETVDSHPPVEDTLPVAEAKETNTEDLKVEEATAEMEATTTPDTTIPVVEDLSEKKEPEISRTNLSDSMTPSVITEKVVDDGSFNFRKSRWQTIYAFESYNYQTPFNYTSSKGKPIFNDSKINLYGLRMGFGREFYLFGGMYTTSRVEGFYTGSAFGKAKSADPDVKQEYANSKTWAQNYGVDITQSFGFIKEVKTKNPFMDEITHFTFEPFVEAGIGASKFMSKASFHYDTTPAGANTSGILDNYRHKIDDNIVNARVGIGFNITGKSGFFMFTRVTQNRFNIISRTSSGYSTQNGSNNVDIGARDKNADKNVKMDPITMFTLGGGYKF